MKKMVSTPTTVTSFLNLKNNKWEVFGHKIFGVKKPKWGSTLVSSRWTIHFPSIIWLWRWCGEDCRQQLYYFPRSFCQIEGWAWCDSYPTRWRPALVKDLTAEEKALFLNLYNKLLADKKGLEVLIQTYFGDVRDVYNDLVSLPSRWYRSWLCWRARKLLNSLRWLPSWYMNPYAIVNRALWRNCTMRA